MSKWLAIGESEARMRGVLLTQRVVLSVSFVVFSAAAVLWTSPGFGQVNKVLANPQRRLLLVVGPGMVDKPLVLSAGDMVQIVPFTYPVVPKFMDAKLAVQLEGDRAVENVGQTGGISALDGRTGAAIFLLARERGRTEVRLSLTKDDVAVTGYSSVSYSIDVK